MVRALVLTIAALAAGCATAPEMLSPQARIATDVALALPTPPGYPETTTIAQTGRASYGERQFAFEAILSLGPRSTEIVLTMLGGPRLATITWDEAGISEDRAALAPDEVPVENILADIFLTVWPADAVSAALPEGVSLSVDEVGVRTIQRGDQIIMTATPDPANAARTLVRNEAFGYQVVIVSQSLDP